MKTLKKQKKRNLDTWIFLTLLTLFFWSPMSNAITRTKTNTELKPYQATYLVYWQGLKVGSSTHDLKKIDAHHYTASAVTKPFLKILPFKSSENSQFSVSQNQVHPQRYEYDTQEKNKHKSGLLIFDWQKKRIQSKKSNSSPEHLPLPNNAQDKITIFFQIRNDLRANKKEFNYTVIEADKIKTYHFKITGQESLKTSLGELETLRLEHLSDNQERLTKVWVAKDLDYLMVKLQQFKKGKLTAESRIEDFAL